MATTHSSVFIPRPADDVWAVLGDFHGLKAWFPGIGEVRAEGDARVIVMGPGVEVTETQIVRDDEARTLSYTVAAPILPTTKYVTTVSVVEANGGSMASMEAEIEPDDMAPMIQGVYDNAVQGLKDHFQ
jgi:uncharacterized protein YndB with AHSA1/START domain